MNLRKTTKPSNKNDALFEKMSNKREWVFRQFDVPPLGEVAKFGTNYFLLKIKILAKRERELTTKFAIARTAVSGWT